MGEVIGFKGTPDDRATKWLTMLMLKQSEEVFRSATDEKQIAVREQDKRIYNKFLKNYIKKGRAKKAA